MLLNRAETALMNNPVRAAIQRRYEAGLLLAMGGRVDGETVLEIGAGRGVGTEIILEQFGAARVDAFDLDPKMVALAERRLARFGDRARVRVGDVTQIDAADSSYGAVFDFGIIHHVPDWRIAIRECHRVLEPGGRLFAEEVHARFIQNPLVRRVLEHPQHDRFDAAQFASALEEAGFVRVRFRDVLGMFGFFVAEKPHSA